MSKLRGFLKKYFIFLILGILIPKVVLAADSTTLVGLDLSSPGETISLDIKLNVASTIDEYSAQLTYETSILEFIGIENQNNWKGNNSITDSPVKLSFTHDNGVAGETVVATLKFKVKTDVTKADTLINLEGTAVTQADDTISNLPKVSKTIAIKSTDNTLKDLKLNGKTVVNFSPNTYSYSIQVEAITTTANIDAVLNSSTASFVENYGSRSVQLDYGENVIEIKVRAASNAEKTYVINVNRLDNRGTNNDLKSLILNSGKIKLNFDKNTLEYKIKTYKLSSIDVEALSVDEKATVKIEKPDEIIIGENIINITVTSEDGNEKIYKVTLNNVDYDIDTSLKDIEIFGCDEELEFDPKVFDYEIIYKSKYKDSIVIKPIINATDEDVKIDEPLLEKTSVIEPGAVIQIRVYATDGTESMYTITFVKDTRINFFFLLGLIIFIVLLVIFIKLIIKRNKDKNNKESITKEKPKDIEKTKKLQKINLGN